MSNSPTYAFPTRGRWAIELNEKGDPWSIDVQNLMASASGAILSISHRTQDLSLRALDRWGEKMLRRCSDVLASLGKDIVHIQIRRAAKVLRINNQSVEGCWGGGASRSMLLCVEQKA